MESFKASARYGDWEGTVGADDAITSLSRYLQDQGKIEEDESLIAVSLWIYNQSEPRLRAYAFQKAHNFKSTKEALSAIAGPIPVREVNIDLTPQEFFSQFNMFSVILTRSNLELACRSYLVIEDRSTGLEAG